AQELERCYTQFSRYNQSGCGAFNSSSPEGFYGISVTYEIPAGQSNATGFTLAALRKEKADTTPTIAEAEALDPACPTLTLDHTGYQDTSGPDQTKCW
ncbi:MAG: type IV pilin protein, partial [Arenicellales bacterium]|nr:type IV pilin protein [Arenicellales bacterium]